MKLGKRKFSDIHREYKEFKKKDKDLLSLYNQVKREYIENKDLDITLEKIYLEYKLNNYKGETLNFYINMLYTLMTIIITLAIERSVSGVNIILAIFVITISAIIYILLMPFINKKVIRIEIDQHIYYSVCFEVINEIENHKNTRR